MLWFQHVLSFILTLRVMVSVLPVKKMRDQGGKLKETRVYLVSLKSTALGAP